MKDGQWKTLLMILRIKAQRKTFQPVKGTKRNPNKIQVKRRKIQNELLEF